MKKTEFTKIFYRKLGRSDGPWIIFIHGLMGTHANWRRITPAFESEYQIVTYDQRCHGKSFSPATGFDPKDYAQDLLELMNHLEIKKAVIVGHSAGGRTAMSFAGLHPERIEKLVMEDIGPGVHPNVGSDLADKLRAVPVPFESRLAAKNYLLNDYGDAKMGQYLYTNITENEKGQAVWRVNLDAVIKTLEIGRSHERWDELHAVQCPTLVIRGADSLELEDDEFQRMARENKNVRLVEIKNSGHWVHADQPDAFIDAVKKFLQNEKR